VYDDSFAERGRGKGNGKVGGVQRWGIFDRDHVACVGFEAADGFESGDTGGIVGCIAGTMAELRNVGNQFRYDLNYVGLSPQFIQECQELGAIIIVQQWVTTATGDDRALPNGTGRSISDNARGIGGLRYVRGLFCAHRWGIQPFMVGDYAATTG
jgi:hypothetical protein